MAVRQGAADLERLIDGHQVLAGENLAHQGDLLAIEAGDVGDGPGLDLAAFAIALADEVGRRRVTVGDTGDVYAHN